MEVDERVTKPELYNARALLGKREPMPFSVLAKILDAVHITADYKYLKYIHDPFALILLLDPVRNRGYDRVPKGKGFDFYTCEDIYYAFKNREEYEIVSQNMNSIEKAFLKKIHNGELQETMPPEQIFRALSRFRSFEFKEAFHLWTLQPNPYAIAFSLINAHTEQKNALEAFTPRKPVPAKGFPINWNRMSTVRAKTRYPCLLQPYTPGDRAMVHKTFKEVRVFVGDDVFTSGPIVRKFKKQVHSGVIDGVVDGRDFTAFDLLEVNNVWLYDRPLSDRMKFFWHFGEFFAPSLIARSPGDLREFAQDVVAKPLNGLYCPLEANMIRWKGESVFLEIYRVGQYLGLKTNDHDHVAMLPEDMQKCSTKEQNTLKNKIVEVDAEGNILQFMDGQDQANSRAEVMDAFGATTLEEFQIKDTYWRVPNVLSRGNISTLD